MSCAEPVSWEWVSGENLYYTLTAWDVEGSLTLVADEGDYRVTERDLELSYSYIEHNSDPGRCAELDWEPAVDGGCERTVEGSYELEYARLERLGDSGWHFKYPSGEPQPGTYDVCTGDGSWEWASVEELSWGKYIGLLTFEPA